jgi:glyoxylase-like metal-dependent hydrolase (beta-lactamase superfamily II)
MFEPASRVHLSLLAGFSRYYRLDNRLPTISGRIPMLKQVAEGVLVHQSELLQNNTAVVQGPTGALVVDAGITGDEMVCLANDLRELGQPVVAGFSTHPDWDHVLWHAELGEAPRYGTARCAAFMRDLRSKADWKARAAEGLPPEIAGETPLELFGLITALPEGTAQIPWDGPRVRVVEHPAHAPGHAALLIEERGVLVAGDMLSDLFIPMLDNWNATNDPIEEYLVGLRLLEDVADGVDVVIPGHGSVGRGGQLHARIEQDRAYVHALRDGHDPDDPRIGPSAEPGWEWVTDIHEGQARSLADQRERDGAPG